jgi:hypothetical protein
MTIAGQTFTVNQAGATGGCSFSINPTSQNFAAGGGNGTVNVTTTASCSWMAVSNAGFIMITGGGSGTGSGVVSFSVAANTSSTPRSGTLTIAGQTFTVNQAGAASACSFTLNPVSKVFGRSGGSSTVSVTTSPGCAWTAVSNAPWITITGGASGSGSGVMSYTVSATTTTRTGTITIAGKTFTIKQSAF